MKRRQELEHVKRRKTPLSVTGEDGISFIASAKKSVNIVANAHVQNFAIGTRIEKPFEVKKGSIELFGGTVTAWEEFLEDDGTCLWGYRIDYDDGDQEHMLEEELAKYVKTKELPNVQKKKRTELRSELQECQVSTLVEKV